MYCTRISMYCTKISIYCTSQCIVCNILHNCVQCVVYSQCIVWYRMYCIERVVWYTMSTHCNTLQHTATHCNTLPYEIHTIHTAISFTKYHSVYYISWSTSARYSMYCIQCIAYNVLYTVYCVQSLLY